MGWCPHCHSNALVLGEVQWDGLSRDCTSIEGREHHLKEIMHTQCGFDTEENLAIVKEKFIKYKEIKFSGIEITQ